MAQDKYSDVMINPSDSLKEMMVTEARKLTFQGTPEGVFGYISRGVNVPYLKPVVPFVNTPTNVVKEGFDRTLNIYQVYNAIKKGSGPELDDALQTCLGNTIAMTMFGIANGD